jgi:hypothetical protein
VRTAGILKKTIERTRVPVAENQPNIINQAGLPTVYRHMLDPIFFLSISFERLSVAMSFLSTRTSFLSVIVFWILVMLKNDVVMLKNDVVMLKYDGSTLK